MTIEFQNYYEMIGVSATATQAEIEQAYRQLARQHTPDLQSEDETAATRARNINEAHAVLGDADKRLRYDQLRQDWQRHHENGSQEAPFDWSVWTVAAANGTEARASQTDDAATDYSDFFKAIFSYTSLDETDSERNNQTEAKAKIRQYVQKLPITLEESFKGASRTLKIGNQYLKIKIPKGAKNGTKIRLKGKQIQLHHQHTDPNDEGVGELLLETELQPHPIFEADGDDLLADLPMDLYTAVLGGEAIVPNLGKGKVKLKIPGETQPGKLFRLKGLGMPKLADPDERGDLLVRAVVSIPQNLTPEEIALFEELADLRDF